MSTETHGLINRKFNIEEMVVILKGKLGATIIMVEKPTNHKDSEIAWINFTYNNEKISIFTSKSIKDVDTITDGTTFKAYHTENSERLVRLVVEEFGGYVIPNDSEEDSWEAVEYNPTVNWTEYFKEDLEYNLGNKVKNLEYQKKLKEKELNSINEKLSVLKEKLGR